ncbi:hypothetical protein HK102_011130 [Quaeritorhiza haematococci]|nr:hypothetical protein HK102_011130 [Quaeritorhiza haematococci]
MRSQRQSISFSAFLLVFLLLAFLSTPNYAHPVSDAVIFQKRQTNDTNSTQPATPPNSSNGTSLGEIVEAALNILQVNQSQISTLVNAFGKPNVRNFINSLNSQSVANKFRANFNGGAVKNLNASMIRSVQTRFGEQNVARLVEVVADLGPERASRAISRRVGFTIDAPTLQSVNMLFGENKVDVRSVFRAMPPIAPEKVVEAARLASSMGGNRLQNLNAQKVDQFKREALAALDRL